MELNSQCWGDDRRSILAGCECELAGPFGLHQVWNRMLTELSSVRQQKALIGALSSEGINFEDLDQRANALAQHLRNHFQRPEGSDWIIAVCLPPSTELIISLLAIFKAGAAYLPLDPTFPSNRVAHILSDANPALLLTCTSVLDDTHFDRIQENLALFRIDTYSFISDECYKSERLVGSQPYQELAVVLYTSGSTGTPKGVRLTHHNIYNRLHWQWRTFPYAVGEVAIFKTALTFVDSIAEIWAPLLKGIPIVIVPKVVTQNPERFVDTLERFKVTRLVLVPSLLSSILSNLEKKDKLRYLRLWVCSGEVLPVHLLHQFYQNLNGVVCNFYGSTEITGDVTSVIFRCKEDVDSSLVEGRVPLGSALDNCAVYILNSMGEPVERGQIGEVFISGAHVADGYIKGKEVMNNNSFVTNTIEENKKGHEILYRTGDYGRIVNGQLYYEGRADSQIKIRGHRVDLTEINAVLNQLDQVEKGVVLCWKPGQPEQEIVAFVVSSNQSTIHQSLKERLVSYAMPRVVFVEEIPLLVNGKIDRQLLLRDYAKNYRSKPCICKWNENELNRLDEKVRNLASALFKTVSSVLGGSLHRSLSLTDNYFYVGGNSLNAVIVVTKLRDQGFYLELGDFLEAENFQQVVSKMEESKCANRDRQECLDQQQNISEYKIEQLNPSVKEEVIRMMCECFSQKGDLELLTGVTYEDYEALVPDLWEPILLANLSFVVKNGQDRIVACGMNCDAFNVPVLHPKAARLGYVFEVLEHVKGPFRESLVDGKKGQVLQNFLVATDGILLSPAENVALVQCVERETLSLAKRNGFQSIFTSNSSPLTQQICNDVLDYKILSEYQVNQFVASDGTKPFAQAPDSLLITISVKNL